MSEARDVIEMLAGDHGAICEIADQLDATIDPTVARTLLARLIGDLAAHEHAEQQVIYPALRDVLPATSTETTSRQAEHDEIDELLAEMTRLDPTGLAFIKRTGALTLEIRAHFQAEEDSLFPKLRSALGQERLVDLMATVTLAKQHAPLVSGRG